MSETLQRQWSLLRAIPRAPHSIDAGALIAQLNAAGFRADKRTVQRDLKELSRIFPLKSDSGSAPNGWYWLADAPAIDVPMMDGATALSVRIIEELLLTLAPTGLGGAIAPELLRARAVLASSCNDPASPLTDRVRVVASDMLLHSPKTNQDVVREVFRAVLTGKRLQLSYAERTPALAGDSHLEVNPLALIVRGRVVWLVCSLVGSVDTRQFALHRVRSAIMTDTAVVRPVHFDLDVYIQRERSRPADGTTIELKVRFRRSAIADLYDTPLSDDQFVEDADAEHVIVSASVRNTPQLLIWLLGFGELAEVLKPESLRQSIERSQRIAAQQYIRRSP